MPPRAVRPKSAPVTTAATTAVAAGDARVALLRGVNVNGKNIAMADLRDIAAALGWGAPATLINSGNLVYRSNGGTPDDDALKLHEAIADRVGIRSTIFIRTEPELRAALTACPLRAQAAENPSRLLVTLWDAHVTPAMLQAFTDAPVTVEQFVVGAHALYTWHPDGISASTVYDKAARAMGHHITARNWSTMSKLLLRLAALNDGTTSAP